MTAALAPIVPQLDPPPRTPLEIFLNPPDDGRKYELVNGEIVIEGGVAGEDMSPISSWVASELCALLRNAAVGPPRLGWAITEVDVMCFPFLPKPQGRRPDVAYFSIDRLPAIPAKPSNVPPNFVAEVISPSDNAFDLERKLGEYLQAGVDVLWVLNPDQRTIRVHRHNDATLRIYQAAETITLGPLLPGFSALVADLFPPPPVPEPAAGLIRVRATPLAMRTIATV